MSINSSHGGPGDALRGRYERGARLYRHRKFEAALEALGGVLRDVKVEGVTDAEWVARCYILFAEVEGLLCGEIMSSVLTRPHVMLFPGYADKAKSEEILVKVRSGWLFDEIYALGLGDNEDCLLACLEVEIGVQAKVEPHIGHILQSRGLPRSERVLQLYLAKDVVPRQGKHAVREILARMLSLETEEIVQRWLDWADGLKETADDNDESHSHAYDSEYYDEDEVFCEEESDSDSFVTANAAGDSTRESRASSRRDVSTIDTVGLPKAVTTAKLTEAPSSYANPILARLDVLVSRFGGIVPLALAIFAILTLANARTLLRTRIGRRIVHSIQQMITMAVKVTYL